MIDEIEGVISDIEAGVASDTRACVDTLRRVQDHIARCERALTEIRGVAQISEGVGWHEMLAVQSWMENKDE